MRNIRDTVHGFQERPHYEASELDTMFERAVTGFLKKKYGVADFPISTDDITTLIEQDVSDQEVEKDIASHPAQSVVGALVVGILIGRLLGRR